MKRFKIIILNWLVKSLFKGLRKNDVFRVKNGKLQLDGEECKHDHALKYRDEALKILHSPVWKMVNDKIVYKAEEAMFKKSKTTDDLFFGKAMLYDLDLVNECLKKLSTIK